MGANPLWYSRLYTEAGFCTFDLLSGMCIRSWERGPSLRLSCTGTAEERRQVLPLSSSVGYRRKCLVVESSGFAVLHHEKLLRIDLCFL